MNTAVTPQAPAARGRRRRTASPGGAALRSALVPGWGQWAAGWRGRGAALFAVFAVPTVAIAVLVLGGVRAFVRLPGPVDALVDFADDAPMWLAEQLLGADWGAVWRAALAVNVAVALIRILVSLDAAALAARARRAQRAAQSLRPLGRSRSGTAAIVLAVALVVAPHVALLAGGYAARPLLDRVLVPQGGAGTPGGAGGGTRTAGSVSPADQAAPEGEPGRPTWDGVSRLNVLLLGTDRRPQEASERPWGNSDTILLVSLDPVAHTAAMISIPRDIFLSVPGIGPEKINAAYREGGPSLAVRVVGDLVGQPIHRWASVDVSAFARMIDAVGGVVVDIERPIRDDEYPAEDFAIRRIYLPSGLQWLTGEQALWFARSRHNSNDFDRAARQQALLLALKDRARDHRLVGRLPALVTSLADAAQTDVTPREALALLRLGGSTDFRSARLVLTPPEYGREVIRPNLYAIEPNIPRIRAAVAETLAGAPPSSGGTAAFSPAQGGAGPGPLYEPGEDVP